MHCNVNTDIRLKTHRHKIICGEKSALLVGQVTDAVEVKVTDSDFYSISELASIFDFDTTAVRQLFS